MARIIWRGDDGIRRRMTEYQNRVQQAIYQVAQYWQGVFQTYAKENAPWTDRTGNARQSLHSFIERLSGNTVRVYLSHGVNYGLFLEVRWQSRYATIWPTIERHLPEIRRMLQGIFRR